MARYIIELYIIILYLVEWRIKERLIKKEKEKEDKTFGIIRLLYARRLLRTQQQSFITIYNYRKPFFFFFNLLVNPI